MSDLAAASDRPRFSVVVPTRNRPEFLAEAIDSIRAQSISDLEIIVVDDCGDVPLALPDDERVRVVRNAIRKGPAGAFNVGAAAARGQILTFCADDDWWTPNRLELAEQGLLHAPVALCFARYSDELGRRGRRRVLRGWIGDKVMNPRWTPSMHGMALRTECWIGLDERYMAGEDTEFALRLFNLFHVWTVPEFGYLVRRHDQVRDIHGPIARAAGMRLLLSENEDWFRAHRYARAFRTRRIGLTYAAIDQHSLAIAAFWESLRILPTPGALRDLARSSVAQVRHRRSHPRSDDQPPAPL